MIQSIATIVKLILALLIAHSMATGLLTIRNPAKYLDNDLRVLIISKTKGPNYYILRMVNFDLNAKANITMVISPYEMKYLRRCLNTALRLLLSNGYNVTLVIPNGKWNYLNMTLTSDISYCWGPNCAVMNPRSKIKIIDDSVGSYQFISYILTNAYGLAGKLEAMTLLKNGYLYSLSPHIGIWVNGKLLGLGSYLLPYYCSQPANFILMIESVYGR